MIAAGMILIVTSIMILALALNKAIRRHDVWIMIVPTIISIGVQGLAIILIYIGLGELNEAANH